MEKKMRGIHGGVVVVYMGLCCVLQVEAIVLSNIYLVGGHGGLTYDCRLTCSFLLRSVN